MQEQQIQPILDAIDDDQFPYALQLIEKVQKRYRKPDSTLLGLQGICLCRLGRYKESIAICETLRTAQPGIKRTYLAIHDILKATTDRESSMYLVSTMGAGYRAIKTETMGRMWFIEAARAGDLVAQRKAAVELQKGFISRDYFYLVLTSMLLLHERRSDAKEKTLLGMLMYRMISKAAQNISVGDSVSEGPRIETNEEFYLYLDILKALGKDEEMLAALEGPHGRNYANHDFLLLKLELCQSLKQHEKALAVADAALDANVDDWLVFKAYVDAAHAKEVMPDNIRAKLRKTSGERLSRNALLACVYTESLQTDRAALSKVLLEYLEAFPDKLATYEDLAPYLNSLTPSERDEFLTKISVLSSIRGPGQVILDINIIKFRLLLAPGTEGDIISSCLKEYVRALTLGKDLLEQDNQYGDDLLILAVQQSLKARYNDRDNLLTAAVLLEHGLTYSKHNFQFRLLLISVYRQLGAWSSANVHFQALSIKHIQHDTLSYILLENSTLEYASTMQLTALRESQHIYDRNKFETPDMICEAYENKTYSKVAEFMDFRDRLDNSIWWHQSQVQTWTLQLLLDKFSHSQVVKSLGDEKIFDNKSRHVMLDIHYNKHDNASHEADAQAVEQLRGDIEAIRRVQAVVTGKNMTDESQPEKHQSASLAHELVVLLHQLRFTMTEVKPIVVRLTALIDEGSAVDDVTAETYSQVTLNRLGSIVTMIKYYAIMAPHIKSLPTSVKTAMQQLRNKTRLIVEALRQSIVNAQLDIPVPAEVQVDAKLKLSIESKIKTSQRESVTCLLGILKGIKL